MRSSASATALSISTSIDRLARRTAAMTTRTATNSAATASASWWPARTNSSPTSTASEPARSEAKWTALAASAAEPVCRDARRLVIARAASITITTPRTVNAHHVTST